MKPQSRNVSLCLTRLRFGCFSFLPKFVIAYSLFIADTFSKPPNLLQRPFNCPVDDCSSSYRRKDHLTRHLIQHQGKLFTCAVKNCNRRFAFQGNMKRHMKELHNDESSSDSERGQKQYVCHENGCGKVFNFASKLRKHEDSHVKIDSMEALCSEPGCMKYFTNVQCLKEHSRSCHQHVTCEKCGTKQLKKNIKRHLRMHEAGCSSARFKCDIDNCSHAFSTKSNLLQHMKAVHLELRPFACGIPGCGRRFPFKHVRDNHEKSGCHIYTPGDFEESDEQFQTRPRGGRKRKYPVIDSLLRKRITPPSQLESILSQGPDYLSWLLSEESENQQ